MSSKFIFRCLLLVGLLLVLPAPQRPAEISAAPAAAPVAAPLPSISVAGSFLLAGGTPFEIRGVNYFHTIGADPSCPRLHFGADPTCPWDINAIANDMDRLRNLGVNTVRIFLNYYVFGGARAEQPDYNLQIALAHLDEFIAVANQRGIYVLPVLLEKYPQDRMTLDHYPTAFALHIYPVLQHLAGHPGILALDLFNEPDLAAPVEPHCWDWDNGAHPRCLDLANERIRFLDRLAGDARIHDPGRPLTIGLGFAKSHYRPQAAQQHLAYLVDIYTFHYYDRDLFDCGCYAYHWYYGQGFPSDLQRATDELILVVGPKPVIVTELGFITGEGSSRPSLDDLHRDLRTSQQILRDAGAAGMILWPFQDPPEALIGTLFVE